MILDPAPRLACALARLRDETGQTLAEYGVILVLVSIVAVAILTLIGGQVTVMFTSAINAF